MVRLDTKLDTSASGDPVPMILPPLPGDTQSVAFAINPRGKVAGVSRDDSFASTAVVWDRNGRPTTDPEAALAGSTVTRVRHVRR